MNRSLTGKGNRETLKILSEIVDLDIREVPSGTECFDWAVPDEWNVNEAWIKNSDGIKVVDYEENNLHLLGYSQPYSGIVTCDELRKHLYTDPSQPDVIPYRTSYYSPRWGFCISENTLKELNDTNYEVLINAVHDPKGSMTIAEAFIPGESEMEILISTYICHPSMANNELSGPLVAAFLYDKLKESGNRHYSVRFLFMPETIGAIWYLSEYGDRIAKNLIAGYVLTCIGDAGQFTYKRSRRGNSTADSAAEYVLQQSCREFILEDFFPTGSDERQYCSPGFDLPVGSLMRTRYGKYKEYHTSADNKSFISFEAMDQSVNICADIIDTIDLNGTYYNTLPYCEPQLGKRGLYPTLGSVTDTAVAVEAMMWVLNLSDGNNDLLGISKRSRLGFEDISKAAESLVKSGIIRRIR